MTILLRVEHDDGVHYTLHASVCVCGHRVDRHEGDSDGDTSCHNCKCERFLPCASSVYSTKTRRD